MIVKAPEQAFPAVSEGTHSAICVDEIHLGMVKSTFSNEERERDMVRLVWQVDEEDKDGRPQLVKQDYTASLGEKAKLRKHLQTWRGRAFTETELFGFDLESIIGAPCLLGIVNNKGRKGGLFSNVDTIMKLPKGMSAVIPRDYTRFKDRPKEQQKPGPDVIPATHAEPEGFYPDDITDDDVPF